MTTLTYQKIDGIEVYKINNMWFGSCLARDVQQKRDDAQDIINSCERREK